MTGAGDNKTSATTHNSVHWLRLTIVILGAIALYIFGRWLSQMLIGQFASLMHPHNEPLLHRVIMTATVVYIIFLAIPFMPAAEIGLSMLLIFGGKIAPLVYLSTLIGLVVAYGAGRLLPKGSVAQIFSSLGLIKASRFASDLTTLTAQERIARMQKATKLRFVPYIIRHRFLVLALLLNVPGNVVIGGGGGIALTAGMTRLFSFPAYVATVGIAIAPLPLMVYITG